MRIGNKADCESTRSIRGISRKTYVDGIEKITRKNGMGVTKFNEDCRQLERLEEMDQSSPMLRDIRDGKRR